MKITQEMIFREGKYLDFWSTTHTLIGFILFWFFQYLGWSISLNFIISFIIIFGWEFFELYVIGNHEPFWNKFFDVVTGVIGWLIMYYLVQYYGLKNLLGLEIILTVIYLLLGGWGIWHNHFKKYFKRKK
jgi:purine-cytosine permease-like protein